MVGVALAILLERRVAPRRIGGRFGPRLFEVRRIVDHRGEVALGGAAEIVVGLVFVVAGVVRLGPRSSGHRPQGPATAAIFG